MHSPLEEHLGTYAETAVEKADVMVIYLSSNFTWNTHSKLRNSQLLCMKVVTTPLFTHPPRPIHFIKCSDIVADDTINNTPLRSLQNYVCLYITSGIHQYTSLYCCLVKANITFSKCRKTTTQSASYKHSARCLNDQHSTSWSRHFESL
jgi:hypothetical protein